MAVKTEYVRVCTSPQQVGLGRRMGVERWTADEWELNVGRILV